MCSTSKRVRERERLRGQHAGRVAGVDARLLDVLHHGGDVDVLPVAQRVDVDLDRVLDEPVDEHRAADRAHRRAELVVVVADPHRAAAEHVRRAHEHRVADLVSAAASASSAPSTVAHGGQRTPSSRASAPKQLAVLGQVDRGVRRAHDPVAGGLDPAGEPQRRLPAELGHDAVRASPGRGRRAPPPARAARSRGGRRCRSRSRPSRGCS